MLGFGSKQLGWAFVAGAVVLFVLGFTQENHFHYWLDRSFGDEGSSLILATVGPVVLYAVLRAIEARGGG